MNIDTTFTSEPVDTFDTIAAIIVSNRTTEIYICYVDEDSYTLSDLDGCYIGWEVDDVFMWTNSRPFIEALKKEQKNAGQ